MSQPLTKVSKTKPIVDFTAQPRHFRQTKSGGGTPKQTISSTIHNQLPISGIRSLWQKGKRVTIGAIDPFRSCVTFYLSIDSESGFFTSESFATHTTRHLGFGLVKCNDFRKFETGNYRWNKFNFWTTDVNFVRWWNCSAQSKSSSSWPSFTNTGWNERRFDESKKRREEIK